MLIHWGTLYLIISLLSPSCLSILQPVTVLSCAHCLTLSLLIQSLILKCCLLRAFVIHLTSLRGESLAEEVQSHKFHLHNEQSRGAGQDPDLLSNPAFIRSLFTPLNNIWPSCAIPPWNCWSPLSPLLWYNSVTADPSIPIIKHSVFSHPFQPSLLFTSRPSLQLYRPPSAITSLPQSSS